MNNYEITDDLKENLNNKGYKLTPQRKAILEVVTEHKGKHLNPEEIYELVSRTNPGIGIATVYRTLPLLEKMGYLRKIMLDDGFTRYEINNPDEHHFHHHLICTSCGAVSGIQEDMLDDLEEQIFSKSGFIIKNHSVKFYGYCQKCSSNLK